RVGGQQAREARGPAPGRSVTGALSSSGTRPNLRPVMNRFLNSYRRPRLHAYYGLRGEASQTLTVVSELAVARRLPSVLKTTLKTWLVFPLRERISWPLLASQTSI